ncbi:MAG: sulfite exporter TauE/SafE family protein [Deltaproteobacteria bacterium]|nr:MAG: sulfite exporter TauE/SafE family protein [Deltaproteobacteria bacterium]
MPAEYLWLLPLGLLIGAFGTLIGAGGGFVLVPILLLVYPNEKTQLITGISLAVVFFNALSGSLAYARMKRVDYKSGILFSIATIPGAILGALSTAYVPRGVFDLLFGVLMIVAAIYLWTSGGEESAVRSYRKGDSDSDPRRRRMLRDLTDAEGVRYHYAYNPVTGVLLSLVVGFISSLLGVGGGFIHVPILTRLLDFPVHIATATSHFVLAIMSLTGTLVHVAQGVFVRGIRRTTMLAIGVLIGAQGGAWMSNRIGGKMIIRGLAVALAFVGVRLIVSVL